jgi:hypothetical protein
MCRQLICFPIFCERSAEPDSFLTFSLLLSGKKSFRCLDNRNASLTNELSGVLRAQKGLYLSQASAIMFKTIR